MSTTNSHNSIFFNNNGLTTNNSDDFIKPQEGGLTTPISESYITTNNNQSKTLSFDNSLSTNNNDLITGTSGSANNGLTAVFPVTQAANLVSASSTVSTANPYLD